MGQGSRGCRAWQAKVMPSILTANCVRAYKAREALPPDVVLYGGSCEVRTEIGTLDTLMEMVEHMYIRYRIDGHAFSY